MQVLITGGSGSVGKAVVQRLVARGDQVKVIGRTRDLEIPGAVYEACDITDYPALRQALRGIDAVVHLAAIPHPAASTGEKIFQINVQGTFNIFKACEEEGIRRVVQASSINAMGQLFGLKAAPLHYLPVDEEHPRTPTDAYSFSKYVIEEIGEYYWQRSGISSIALRLPWVVPAEYHTTNPARQARARELCDRLAKLSTEERQAWFEGAWSRYNELRAQGIYENRASYQEAKSLHPDWFGDDWFAMSHRVNFWTCLDERDSAQAVEKGLVANYGGSHVLFVNDDQNWTGLASNLLAELFYPDVKVFKKELVGTGTLVSIDRAKELIGFEIEYTFGG
jgi:nucleoside-diphosphate-sugar epimerase